MALIRHHEEGHLTLLTLSGRKLPFIIRISVWHTGHKEGFIDRRADRRNIATLSWGHDDGRSSFDTFWMLRYAGARTIVVNMSDRVGSHGTNVVKACSCGFLFG